MPHPPIPRASLAPTPQVPQEDTTNQRTAPPAVLATRSRPCPRFCVKESVRGIVYVYMLRCRGSDASFVTLFFQDSSIAFQFFGRFTRAPGSRVLDGRAPTTHHRCGSQQDPGETAVTSVLSVLPTDTPRFRTISPLAHPSASSPLLKYHHRDTHTSFVTILDPHSLVESVPTCQEAPVFFYLTSCQSPFGSNLSFHISSRNHTTSLYFPLN